MPIPAGILEDDESERLHGDRKRLRAGKRSPRQLGAGVIQRDRERRPGLRILQRRVERPGRLDLCRGQAAGTIRTFARHHFRIEFAPRRIVDHAVLHAVQRIARVERCGVNRGIFFRRDVTVRTAMNDLADLNSRRMQPRRRHRNGSGDDRVVVGWIARGFDSALPAAC